MGKYYCDYCKSYLTHDSFSVRKSHLRGSKHLKLYNEYYDKIIHEHPELSGLDELDKSNDQIVSKIYKNIPGNYNPFGDTKHNGRNNEFKTKFKLKVPETSIGLPNPPPNVLYYNFTTSGYKNRLNKPYLHENNYTKRDFNNYNKKTGGSNYELISQGKEINKEFNHTVSTKQDIKTYVPPISKVNETHTMNHTKQSYGYGYRYNYGNKQGYNGQLKNQRRYNTPTVNNPYQSSGYRQQRNGYHNNMGQTQGQRRNYY